MENEVLVHVRTGGPISVVQAEGNSESLSIKKASLGVGLSFCTQEVWGLIFGGPSWARRSVPQGRDRSNKLKPPEVAVLAGHLEGLEQDWSALPVKQIESLLELADRKMITRLQVLEQECEHPRARVMQACRAARATLDFQQGLN